MPAIQLAELLAEFSDVKPDVPRQTGPVSVALLDADLFILEAREDLRARVRVERRLEPDFELAGIEVVVLGSRRTGVRPHVPRGADFGIELWLAALAPHELGAARRVRLELGGVGPRGRGRRGAERGQLVRRRRVPLGLRRARRVPRLGTQAIELGLERTHLGRQ